MSDDPFDAAVELKAEEDVLDSREAGDKVIRGGAVRIAAYATGIIIGLISTPLMVRHLGVTDFGRYVTVSSLLFIVTGLTEGGLFAIGVREYSQREPSARARLIRNLFGMRVVLTFVGVAGALAFGLIAGYDDTMLFGILVSSLGLAVLGIIGVYSVPLNAWLRLGWLASLDLMRQATLTVVIVALVIGGAALGPFFVANPISTLPPLLAAWLLVRRQVPSRPAFDVREWWPLLRDSLPYAAALAVSVLYFRVGVIVSSIVSSETETGYYSLAFRIVEIVSGVPWLLAGSAFPVLSRAARDDRERLSYAVGRTYQVSLLLGVWVAISIGLGAPFAVEVIGGGSEFDPSVEVLSILGVAMIGTFLIACWGQALLTLRRHAALLGANVSAFVLGTVLSVVLVSAHGALGAAIATSITELWLAAVYAVLITRADPQLRPSARHLPPVALAAGIALAPPLLLGTPSVVSALLGTLLFFGALAAMRQIPPEIVQALRVRGSRHA